MIFVRGKILKTIMEKRLQRKCVPLVCLIRQICCMTLVLQSFMVELLGKAKEKILSSSGSKID